MKILVTTSSFGKADRTPLDALEAKCEVKLNPYGRKLTTEEFIDLSADADGVIAGVESITREALEKRPNIRVISRCGVGMDSVDIEACKELGVKVFNTPNAPVRSVAELTVTLLLTLLKNVPNMDRSIKSGGWDKLTGLMLEGKKVGVIGMGRIGRRVAELLSAFGTEIAYSDVVKLDVDYPYMEKDALLEWADIVTLHTSASDGYVIGERELARMKRGAYLVNTSRGKFIDEDALCRALSEKRLAGAALDVYREEPYRGPLTALDNVVLTPHVASSAKEGRVKMELEAVQNLFEGLGI